MSPHDSELISLASLFYLSLQTDFPTLCDSRSHHLLCFSKEPISTSMHLTCLFHESSYLVHTVLTLCVQVQGDLKSPCGIIELNDP